MQSNNGYSPQDQSNEPGWQRSLQSPSSSSYQPHQFNSMRSTKSQGQMPLIHRGGSAKIQQSQYGQPRSREEQEIIFKHLTSPTKSLELRSKAIKSWKADMALMYKKNSRILDNHFAPKIHSSAWIAPGLSKKQQSQMIYRLSEKTKVIHFFHRKYESDSTGIAITVAEKDIEFKIQQDKLEVLKLQKEGFRQWAEFERIREGESILTIEYCTNCKDHQGTTRHDERKYEYIANNLKKEILRHYPTIKVYMKPLLTEAQEQSIENQYARSRLGALEVQFCTNRGGKVSKNVVFSKLKTKSWPSTIAVLNDIRKYMDKCTLTVQILHESFDPAELSEEKKRSAENKLYNVEVILRPHRKVNPSQPTLMNQSGFINTQSNPFLQDAGTKSLKQLPDNFDMYSVKSRPNSAFNRGSMRPLSAQSAFSVQSHSHLPQIHGQASHAKTIEIKEKSNTDGLVTFTDLPYDVYTLEIKETNDFRSCKDQIDVFKKVKEQQQPEQLQHSVLLESVQLTFAKIIIKGDVGEKESLIRIIKEGDEDNELEGKMKSEFSVTLDPGKYTVIVENSKLGRIEREHTFPLGTQELQLSFNDALQIPQSSKPQRVLAAPNSASSNNSSSKQRPGSARPQSASSRGGMKKELVMTIYEAGNNSIGIKNCKIEIVDEVRGTKEFTTDSEGVCTIQLDGYTRGSIRINHEQFLPICEEYGPTQMNLNAMKELSFPLIRKPETDNEVNFLMSTDVDKKILTLYVVGPDGIATSQSKKDITIDNNPEQRSSLIKITKTKESKGIYRIFAKVHDLSLLTPSSVKFYAVTSAKTLNFIEVPKSHPSLRPSGELFWDIGVLFVPSSKFIEINAVQTEMVTKDHGLGALRMVIDQVQKAAKRDKNGNQSELRNLLGFPQDDPKVLQSNNDFNVSKERIIESLQKAIGQNAPKAAQLEHLIHSSLLTNGLCSYQKLRTKFLGLEFPDDFTVTNQSAVHEASDEDDDDAAEYYNEND